MVVEFLRKRGASACSRAVRGIPGARIREAISCDAENLAKYVGHHARLSGFPVEGFPVEAGEPGYISVTRIDEAYYSERG